MLRTMILTLVSGSALIAVAGCSAEVPADEDVQVSTSEEALEPKYINSNNCVGASPVTQNAATKLAGYVFGAPLPAGIPAGAACDQVVAALTDLRTGVAADKYTIGHADVSVCTMPAKTVTFTTLNPVNIPGLNSVIERIQANTVACFGQGVLQFLMPATIHGASMSAMYMDPEPATLTANLSSTQGAAASAYYTASLEPTVAKKWNATYGACGTAVAAAEPCSTTALSAGQEATRLIQKTGTLCRCL